MSSFSHIVIFDVLVGSVQGVVEVVIIIIAVVVLVKAVVATSHCPFC